MTVGLFSVAQARELLALSRQFKNRPVRDNTRTMPIVPTPGIRFRNDHTSQVPAYGLMAVTGNYVPPSGPEYTTITQQGTTLYTDFLINGSSPVDANAFGMAQAGPSYRLLYDSGSGTPTNKQGWGPKPGSWKANLGYPSVAIASGVYDSAFGLMNGSFDGRIRTLLGKSTSDIAAASGTSPLTPGSGSVTVWADTGSGYVATSMTFTGYNTLPYKIPAGKLFKWVEYEGRLCAVELASRGWHVSLGGSVADGASTTVTLSDGTSVSATNSSGATLDAGNAVAIEDAYTQTVYLVGGGTGGGTDNMAIVNVYGATPNGDCLWAGKVSTPSNGSSYCSSQFPNTSDCWITVLNYIDGSAASLLKTKLDISESYIGRLVGNISGTDVYAIRVEQQRVMIGKTDSSLSSAASGTISIYTGTAGSESDSGVNVTAFNRTSISIGSSKWVKLTYINLQWYCEPWQC